MGIDQGLAHLGYCFIKAEENNDEPLQQNQIVFGNYKATLLSYGAIFTKPNNNEDSSKRLYNLINKCEDLIKENDPQDIAFEHLFYSTPGIGSRKKSASIMDTNMVTGALFYIIGKNDKNHFTYPPTTVKKSICDSGKANKDDVISKINDLFDVQCNKTSKDHICDSISIALTHLKNKDVVKAASSKPKQKTKKKVNSTNLEEKAS